MLDISPFLTAMVVIGVAELGDKTQLLTLGFATQYPLWQVISAVFSATALLAGGAVIFGGLINHYIPALYVQLFAGIAFIVFGMWTALGREEEKEEESKFSKGAFGIVFTSFLVAELGDKTQLATLALSAKYGAPVQVWLGATLGMAGVNSMGAVAGKWMRQVVPEIWIKWVGATVFVLFGLWTLGKALLF